MRCPDCGATGDKWDRNIEDWSNPREECPHCDGYGEVDDPWGEDSPQFSSEAAEFLVGRQD